MLNAPVAQQFSVMVWSWRLEGKGGGGVEGMAGGELPAGNAVVVFATTMMGMGTCNDDDDDAADDADDDADDDESSIDI
jgi:hypothetical protein